MTEETKEKKQTKKPKDRPARLLFSRDDVAHMLSISTRQVDYLLQRGLIRGFKLGKRRVVIRAEEVRRVAEHGLQGI